MADGPSGRLRLAVVGMGLRGVPMAAYIVSSRPDVELVGLVDRIRPRAELAREYLGLSVPVFDDAAACLDETRPHALAVYTPDACHEQPAVAALDRNVHVYCEKPMATTLASCDRMIAAARKSKAVFYMGQNMRTSPLYHAIHEILAAGEIGELLTLETSEFYHGGRTYFRRWNRLLAVGGGLWITKSVHDFDMMRWLVGDEPAGVFAVGGRKVFQPKGGAAERCRDCDLRCECDDYQKPASLIVGDPKAARDVAFWDRWQQLGEASGYLPHDACLYRGDIETLEYGVATVQFAGGACATHVLNVVTSPEVSGRWLTAHGTKGCIQADPKTDQVRLSYRSAKASRTYDVAALSRGGHGGADERAFEGFVRSCRTGAPPIAGWADGRGAVALGLAAQESMQQGTVVRMDGQ